MQRLWTFAHRSPLRTSLDLQPLASPCITANASYMQLQGRYANHRIGSTRSLCYEISHLNFHRPGAPRSCSILKVTTVFHGHSLDADCPMQTGHRSAFQALLPYHAGLHLSLL